VAEERPASTARSDARPPADIRTDARGCAAHGLVWLVAGSALIVLMGATTLVCFLLYRLAAG
jgi:hypothetical protein